jgi:NAD(P)-dependent dehydrogenase (short-subunit alcohol dehydrogenase family)
MQTVLITGIGRGIGLSLVEEFLKRDYHVIGTVRDPKDRQSAEHLAAKLDRSVEVHILDVTSQASVESLKQNLAGRTLDILVNNAGIYGGNKQSADDFDFLEWEKTLQVNTISPMRVALAMLDNLLKSSQPKIVTLSSIMASFTSEQSDSIAYRSSKAAVNKAMQCLALELKPKNVGVYLIHPGWVRTDMGGPDADISVEQSASGLTETIIKFSLDDSAKFWQFNGDTLAW